MAEYPVHLKLDSTAASSIDAYLEYKRIVGDDDGGNMFTPEEYEKYKKKVLPQRLKNRLFTSWSPPSGMDCKLIGPETPCFCTHRYRQHKTDFKEMPTGRPILLPCKVPRCKCATYHYIPLNGSQPIRCTCKHFSDDHSEMDPYKCKKESCKCSAFKSSYTCGCGEPVYRHTMIVETKEERLARGHPVGQDTAYQAMGGLTGFSSLMDGYMRLDPSGIGAPSKEFLEQPITANDNPFLRANVASIQAHRMAVKGPNAVDEDLAERMSAMRKPGETDMDFYERRYQERQKAERARSRGITAAPKHTGTRAGTSSQSKPSTSKQSSSKAPSSGRGRKM